ncbi:MAG: hypothetical protein ACLFUU_09170 [Desulfobacteraceae bacterium]
MKKSLFFLTMIIIIGMSGQSWGQAGQGRGMGRKAKSRIYVPQTEVTVKGQVAELGTYPSMGPGSAQGMNYNGVILKTDQGDLKVHLGPAWYLDQQELDIQVGDTLEVTGAQTTQNQGTVILAREVTVDGKKMMLRDSQGFPIWRGQGRGMGPGGRGMGGSVPGAK